MRASHTQFIDFFVDEFMAELWYLQKVARGDIPVRKEYDLWETISNISQALLSLAPIPGLSFGYILSEKLLKKCIELGEKIAKAQKIVGEHYEAVMQPIKGAYTLYTEFTDDDKAKDSYFQSSSEGPVDRLAMRLLAELLAHGFAQRYEDVVTTRLDTTQPEKSLLPLARIAAQRCFVFLNTQPFFEVKSSASLLARRTKILNGISVGNLDKSWRDQVLNKVDSWLPSALRDLRKMPVELKSDIRPSKNFLSNYTDKFTAEGVCKNSAWQDEKKCYEVVKDKDHATQWWEKGIERFPKYGYAYLESSADEDKPFSSLSAITPTSRPPLPRNQRFYQHVTLAQIQRYIESSEVSSARRRGETATLTFHAFLQQSYSFSFPTEFQAVCHEDLSAINKPWSFANFSGVDFSGAIISGNITGCCFNRAYLVGTCFKNIYSNTSTSLKAKLQFTNAILAFADLRKMNLTGANLTQADLSFANLDEADLTGIISEGAQWYKTKLRGVKHREVLEEQKIQMKMMQESLEKEKKRMDSLEEEQQIFAKKLLQIELAQQKANDVQKEHLEKMSELIVQQSNISLFKQYCKKTLDELREEQKSQAMTLKKTIARLDEADKTSKKKIDELSEKIDEAFKKIEKVEEKVEKVSDLQQHQEEKLSDLQQRQMALAKQNSALWLFYKTGVKTKSETSEHPHWQIQKNIASTLLDGQWLFLSHHTEEIFRFLTPLKVMEAFPEEESLEQLMQRIDEAEELNESKKIIGLHNIVEAMESFLNRSDRHLLLLLGEPGSGKSTALWCQMDNLVLNFTSKSKSSTSDISKLWLPIYIDLKKYSFEQLFNLVEVYLKTSCKLKDEDLNKLRQVKNPQEPKLLIILDGWEQLHHKAKDINNLFWYCGGDFWPAARLKIIVTCNRHVIDNLEKEASIFSKKNRLDYQRYEILPLTRSQIDECIGDEFKNYSSLFEDPVSLISIARHPFALHILKNLRWPQPPFTRLELYRAFFREWITQKVYQLQLPQSRDELISKFLSAGYGAAMTLFKGGALIYSKIINKDNSSSLYPLVLPLQSNGRTYEFMHKSLYEYLLADYILQVVGNSAVPIIKLKKLKGFFEKEPEVIAFLQEIWQQPKEYRIRKEAVKLYETLTVVIERDSISDETDETENARIILQGMIKSKKKLTSVAVSHTAPVYSPSIQSLSNSSSASCSSSSSTSSTMFSKRISKLAAPTSPSQSTSTSEIEVKPLLPPKFKDYRIIFVFNDPNCLLWSVALAMLLPTLEDENAFHKVYLQLFGNDNPISTAGIKKENELRTILRTEYDYKGKGPLKFSDNTIEKLVCNILRNRVINKMAIFDYPMEYKESLKLMREPNKYCDEHVIGGLAYLLGVIICVFGKNEVKSYSPPDKQSKSIVYLYHQNRNHYRFVLHKSLLPTSKNLSPHQPVATSSGAPYSRPTRRKNTTTRAGMFRPRSSLPLSPPTRSTVTPYRP